MLLFSVFLSGFLSNQTMKEKRSDKTLRATPRRQDTYNKTVIISMQRMKVRQIEGFCRTKKFKIVFFFEDLLLGFVRNLSLLCFALQIVIQF